jgi:RNA polymerase sigma-70 factor (ECF subfamily)
MARGVDRDRWSDFELLSAAAERDGAAFGVFYGRHLSMVVAYLRRQTGDPALTADLTAEVFAAALHSAHRYRDSSESAEPWLLGIAGNVLRMSRRQGRIEDRARRRIGWEPVALEDPDLEQIESLAAGDSGLSRLMASLPAPEREAIERRVLQEQTYTQIATDLKCSEMVVRKRVSRGLARLRENWMER